MLVIKSTPLFDALSPCEADEIHYLSFGGGSMFPINHKSCHLIYNYVFIARQCTVSILSYNNHGASTCSVSAVCLLQRVFWWGSYHALKDSSCFDQAVGVFMFREDSMIRRGCYQSHMLSISGCMEAFLQGLYPINHCLVCYFFEWSAQWLNHFRTKRQSGCNVGDLS